MIRGKTGTLTSVTALSGIMRGKSGKLYLFTLAVNDYPYKNFKRMWKFRDNIMWQIWKSL